MIGLVIGFVQMLTGLVGVLWFYNKTTTDEQLDTFIVLTFTSVAFNGINKIMENL